jgi:chemotaxis methyl-accepting protein methylase
MDDEDFRILLDFMALSFPGYRKVRKGVKKRVVRRMEALGIPSVMDYLELARQDKEEYHCLRLLMTVSISRFFRDEMLWQQFSGQVMPELADTRSSSVTIWCAGCARGEEPYTLAMVWKLRGQNLPHLPPLKLVATDINPDYLAMAKQGEYRQNSLKSVPPEIWKTCFEPIPRSKGFRVKPAFKKRIDWRVHDLHDDPPDKRFDIIFLRNSILMYCNDELKAWVFRRIVSSLANRGFLIKGAHEQLPREAREFQSYFDSPYIFRKT